MRERDGGCEVPPGCSKAAATWVVGGAPGHLSAHNLSAQQERKKENKQPKGGMGGGQGPHLHEQDLGRTIRDTGERERGAHRDTEGGWAGFTHTTGSQGFLSRIGQSCTHPAARGQARASYWLRSPSSPATDKRDSDRFAARWTPYSTGDLSRLATFLRLLKSGRTDELCAR